ncbi:hypothetical protein ACVOMV_28155 [Mesorhizobium atlanticum]
MSMTVVVKLLEQPFFGAARAFVGAKLGDVPFDGIAGDLQAHVVEAVGGVLLDGYAEILGRRIEKAFGLCFLVGAAP